MGKINLKSIQRQLSRVESEIEGVQVLSYPLSLSPAEIVINPNNTAAAEDSDEDIRQLADSIEISGLIHPLTVNKLGDHRYMLLSGERRYKAITRHLNWPAIPCTVYENLDNDMTTIVTVQANMETRSYTAAQRLALYDQLDAALRSQKSKGKFKGGISREVARIMGVSESVISKYKKVAQNTTAAERESISNIELAAKNFRDDKKTFETKVFDKPVGAEKNFRNESFSEIDSKPKTSETGEDVADLAAGIAVKMILRKYNELISWAKDKPENVRGYMYQAHTAIIKFAAAAGLNSKTED